MKKRKKEALPQVHPKCIFCQATGMTKQHIWPAWMGRDDALPTYKKGGNPINIQTVGSRIQYDPASPTKLISSGPKEIIRRQNHISENGIRLVCSTCNNGWMSQIEDASKPIVRALILGEEIVLSTADQLLLSSWAVLMTMVIEFTHIPSKAVPYSDRHLFKNTSIPPANWAVWIGKGSNQGLVDFKHIGVTVRIAIHGKEQFVASIKNNYQTTTIVIGSLLLYIASTSLIEAKHLIDIFSHPKLQKLHPSSNLEIHSDLLPIISNEEFHSIRDIGWSNMEKQSGISLQGQ